MIRPARPEDAAAIVALVGELAEYERARDEVRIDEAATRTALFGPQPAVHAHVVELDGEIAGFAVWFLTFSTWEGRHGIYLEDLFVRPARRGEGWGRALLATLAGIAVERGYARLEWAVLDWNEPALGFYAALGAVARDDWRLHRLSGLALARLGAEGARYHPGP
jgi:GNAT superfamily N-acetyltransferase